MQTCSTKAIRTLTAIWSGTPTYSCSYYSVMTGLFSFALNFCSLGFCSSIFLKQTPQTTAWLDYKCSSTIWHCIYYKTRKYIAKYTIYSAIISSGLHIWKSRSILLHNSNSKDKHSTRIKLHPLLPADLLLATIIKHMLEAK